MASVSEFKPRQPMARDERDALVAHARILSAAAGRARLTVIGAIEEFNDRRKSLTPAQTVTELEEMLELAREAAAAGAKVSEFLNNPRLPDIPEPGSRFHYEPQPGPFPPAP